MPNRFNKHPLSFLFYAGQGIYDYEHDFSTWTPHFPSESIRPRAGTPVEDADNMADSGVFPAYAATARVSGHFLIASGVIVDFVTRLEDVSLSCGAQARFPSLRRYFQHLLSRSRAAPKTSGPRLLQILLRSFRLDSGNHVDASYILYGLTWLRTLLLGEPENRRAVEALVVDALGSELGTDTLDEAFVRDVFSTYDGPSLPWADMLSKADILERESRRVVADMARLHDRWRFFETEGGRFGFAPINTESGDVVCILSGSGFPVVLRRHDSLFSHVGVCFVYDLMHGEAADLVKSGRRDIQTITIV